MRASRCSGAQELLPLRWKRDVRCRRRLSMTDRLAPGMARGERPGMARACPSRSISAATVVRRFSRNHGASLAHQTGQLRRVPLRKCGKRGHGRPVRAMRGTREVFPDFEPFVGQVQRQACGIGCRRIRRTLPRVDERARKGFVVVEVAARLPAQIVCAVAKTGGVQIEDSAHAPLPACVVQDEVVRFVVGVHVNGC